MRARAPPSARALLLSCRGSDARDPSRRASAHAALRPSCTAAASTAAAASACRQIPIGITVEGANILTRSLIVFGQGLNRSHPNLLPLIEAINKGDDMPAFNKHLAALIGHAATNGAASFGLALQAFATAPFASKRSSESVVAFHEAQLGRLARAFAISADLSLVLGGRLKFAEMLSGRWARAQGSRVRQACCALGGAHCAANASVSRACACWLQGAALEPHARAICRPSRPPLTSNARHNRAALPPQICRRAGQPLLGLRDAALPQEPRVRGQREGARPRDEHAALRDAAVALRDPEQLPGARHWPTHAAAYLSAWVFLLDAVRPAQPDRLEADHDRQRRAQAPLAEHLHLGEGPDGPRRDDQPRPPQGEGRAPAVPPCCHAPRPAEAAAQSGTALRSSPVSSRHATQRSACPPLSPLQCIEADALLTAVRKAKRAPTAAEKAIIDEAEALREQIIQVRAAPPCLHPPSAKHAPAFACAPALRARAPLSRCYEAHRTPSRPIHLDTVPLSVPCCA